MWAKLQQREPWDLRSSKPFLAKPSPHKVVFLLQPRTRSFLRDYTRDTHPGSENPRQTARRTPRLRRVVGGRRRTIRSLGPDARAVLMCHSPAGRGLGSRGSDPGDPAAEARGAGGRDRAPPGTSPPPAPPGGKVQRGPANNGAGRAQRATGRRRVAPSGGRGHFQERRPQPPPAGPLSRPA